MGCGSSTAQQPATPLHAQPQQQQQDKHQNSSSSHAYRVEVDAAPTTMPLGAVAIAATPTSAAASSLEESANSATPIRRSVNSKRLTLPLQPVSSGSVGTTTLNLAAVDGMLTGGAGHSLTGSISSRSRGPTPPGSARGRRQAEEVDHETLVSIPFFEGLDKRGIRRLRDAFQRRRFTAGEWISRRPPPAPDAEGEATAESTSVPPPPTGVASDADFFVIISGSVQLSVRVLSSRTKMPTPQPPTRTLERPDPNLLPATVSEDVTLAVLKAGQWFGADVLSSSFSSSFERADILALENCVLLSISREAFKNFAENNVDMQTSISDVVTNTRVSLRSLPFFAEVDELKLQQLSQLLEFRRFAAGDVVCKEGELGDGFFIVVSGHAKVTVQTLESASAFLLSQLGPTDHFGETALLTNGPRVATVSATTPMLLLFLSAERFRRFERLAPEVFSDAFSKIAATRTTQLLKTIPLFDVLCVEQPPSPPSPVLNADSEAAQAVGPSLSPRYRYDEQKLSLLASLFEYENFNLPRTVIFSEGDRADKLYILLRGTVEVSAKVETGVVVLNRLSQGDVFGEISIFFSTVRSATITTLEPCLMLCLGADKFARFLEIAPELKDRLSFAIGPRVATIIENIPFFLGIKENKPWSKLGLLGELCQFQKSEENELVFRTGDKADKFFVLVAGAVLLTRTEEPEDAQARRASGGAGEGGHMRAPTILPGVILRRGNYFGEEMMVDGPDARRWSTATSLSLSVFLTLTRANFDKYVQIAPELKELILTRQQSSQEASGASNVTRGRGGKRASGGKDIFHVASNRSLEASPIFSTADVAARHPRVHRLTTTVPTKTRTLQPQPSRALSVDPSLGSSAPLTLPGQVASSSPKSRSSLGGRLPSLPVLGGTTSTAASPKSSKRLTLAPIGDKEKPFISQAQPDATLASASADADAASN